MDEEWGSEQAFVQFFKLLDEYRTCRSIYLSKAVLQDHKPNFYQERSDGTRIEPEKPLEVIVAQFAPSQVYYLVEIYIKGQEDYFPYQKSIDEVKEVAETRWGVAATEWFNLEGI